MSVNWKKRYSFRLQEEDKEIYHLLQQVPDNKRSETIRQMLRFAYRTVLAGKKTQQDIQGLVAEIKSLKVNQDLQHQELLKKIGNGVAIKNEEVNISIRDTGVGIPEDKLNLIFERFGQVDKTLSRNAEGSGIGLSLVKYLVELHLGRINVYSEEGKGSEFIIILPDKVVDEDKCDKNNNDYISNNVEKMHIEFADIYFNT